MLGRLFSKLLWAPHQGSADAIFGMVDDHDNGGTAAGFAESNPDLQFGEIWDRTFCLPFIVRYLKAVCCCIYAAYMLPRWINFVFVYFFWHYRIFFSILSLHTRIYAFFLLLP